MRIVFMGTPDFAVPCLQKVLDLGHEVAGVFTQPDKPVGRKQILTPPPVKQLALEHNIPVFQPAKMRDGTALQMLQSLKPDLAVVVAYGRILPPDLLAQIPRRRPHPVDGAERRTRWRRYQHVYGRRAGHRRHDPEKGNPRWPQRNQRRAV